MLPQDFTQGLDEAARTGTVYPSMMSSGLSQGVIRPQMGHTVYVHNQGQQFLVPMVAPTQHTSQQPVHMLPHMNMTLACAPMIVDKPVHLLASPAVGVASALYRPAMYTVAPTSRSARPVHGNMWASVPVVGRLEQFPGPVVGQATSVEDILQLLRSMPRGTSAIAIVAESLRYLDSRWVLFSACYDVVLIEIFSWHHICLCYCGVRSFWSQ